MTSRLGAVALLLALTSLAGCPSPPSDGGAGLVAGTYTGSISSSVSVLLNGQTVDSTQASLNTTESINAQGIPLLATGEPISQGDTLILAEAGENLLLGGVSSIQADGGVTTINLNLSGLIDGISVTGTGQIIYTGVSNTSIQFNLSLTYSGTTAEGDVFLQQETQAGTLTQTG